MQAQRNKRCKGYLWTLFLLVLLMAGCAPSASRGVASANVVAALSGEVDAAFARAYEPMPFNFPHDHGAHPQYQTEWWYYTGNLADAQGNPYGFQFTIFRSALTPTMPARESDLATNQIYMAHFAVSDGPGNSHESFERFSRGAGGLAGATGDPEVAIWLEDWQVTQPVSGTMRIQAQATTEDGKQVAIDLQLRETRPPVLHGNAGLSQKGPEAGNASYYYSLVGLETTGTLTTRGRTVEVSGLSWMDHEFGTSALSGNAVGWDWFSLQLENGVALMLAQIRTADGGSIGEFEGTLVMADGSQTRITNKDFALEVLAQWTSPTTGVTYPAAWRLTAPAFDLNLEITPLLRDQEMKVSYVYWEGAVNAEGSMAGAPVAGRGYVELTGYSSGEGFHR
ncbi:MAG: carotenoid 1,2-hydratase [Caldilineaceae bacterium]|nr:carotenoid 1,2-hydratase [Caldilineaceae bacterium]